MAINGQSFFESVPVDHDCKICSRNNIARQDWGCDEPTESVQCYIPCVRCAQTNANCELCGGDGWESIHRCPYSLCDKFTWELMALHCRWPETLLHEGGVYDQPAVYVNAMRILDGADGKIQKIKDDQEKKVSRKNARTRTA